MPFEITRYGELPGTAGFAPCEKGCSKPPAGALQQAQKSSATTSENCLGLGDLAARIFEPLKGWLTRRFPGWFLPLFRDCKCAERRAWLNRSFPRLKRVKTGAGERVG